MKQRMKKICHAIIVILCVLCMAMEVEPVFAADATVHFGSNWYNKRNNETFPIGLYIDSTESIGDYHVEVKYDNLRMEYLDGAGTVDEEKGILYFTGTGSGNEVKFWLRFTAISGGDTTIKVIKVSANTTDGAQEFAIANEADVEIHIRGEDTAAEIEEQLEAERLEQERIEQERLEQERIEQERLEQERLEQEQLAQERLEQERLEQEQLEKERLELETTQTKPTVVYNVYIFFALILLLLIVLIELVVWLVIRHLRKKRGEISSARKQRSKEIQADCIIDLTDDVENNLSVVEHKLGSEIESLIHEEQMEQQYGTPVIQVQDVTMEFHLSSANPSGLKDYLIQVIKRQVTYRRLYALYHVSFNVYKGEVVGIIGTNGSGKSTLLKIVSGALKPTSGKVLVDRRKIQILTLGTGFDMELTAKENVFLNGSIIGYSKEFLEAHYDEIVAFAELEDFMEEKVKNFSSGMVSRLGFAIATAGDAAEILILDEVLSVGDEFFRKKSLARIKELIHGGSTVLLVSHSMPTILEHCTKCVWIEKGELRMVGEPKVVCEEYRRMNEM